MCLGSLSGCPVPCVGMFKKTAIVTVVKAGDVAKVRCLTSAEGRRASSWKGLTEWLVDGEAFQGEALCQGLYGRVR